MTPTDIRAEIRKLQEELRVLLNPHAMTLTETKIYTQAKVHLGQHLTLNDTVPHEEGCMEAVSKVLALSGISDGPLGIPGTASGNDWFKAHPELFELITEPEEGAIANFVTGTGNGSISNGHILIFGAFGVQFPEDWGLMSNDSASGRFLETWSWQRALAYYRDLGGMQPQIWRAK